MTKIYLIRHAEAEGNIYRRMHGQYDSRITPNGMRQIAALEKRFEAIPVDACYASDLNRTSVTARAIYCAKGLTLRPDARFREVGVGRWEDVPFGWLERFEPERMHCFNAAPQSWSVEGSETYADYTARFLSALREAVEEHPDRTIAVFSHGCILRGVLYALLGQWPPHCDNTGVSLLEYEDGAFRAVFLNDNSHLSDEISTLAKQKWWRSGEKQTDFNMWFETQGACARAFLHDRQLGFVRVSAERCAKGEMRIERMEMDAEHCGMRFGEQLLGSAVSTARASGCHALLAAVPPQSRHFFERLGFRSRADAAEDMLLDLRVPQA